MRRPKTITFIATIREGMEEKLRSYLKQSVDMNDNGSENDVAFSKLADLHFCAMFIVARDELLDKPAILVFEATIDGEIREFLENLLDTSPDAFARILGYCEGFPASSMKLKRLAVDYLMLRLVADRAHHCGYHGRTVAQITGEQKLRTAILGTVGEINDNRSSSIPTAADIHRRIKSAITGDEKFNWARAKAEPPATVKHRGLFLSILMFLVVSVPLVIVLIWSYRLFAVSPSGMLELIKNCGDTIPIFKSAQAINCRSSSELLTVFTSNLAVTLAILAVFWLLFIALQKSVIKYQQTVQKSLLNEMAGLASIAGGGVAFTLLMLSAALVLMKMHDQLGTFSPLTGYWKLIAIALVFGLLSLIFGFARTQIETSARTREKPDDLSGWIGVFATSIVSSLTRGIYYFVYYGLLLVVMSIIFWLLRELADALQGFWLWIFSLGGVELNSAPVAEFLGAAPGWISNTVKNIIYVVLAALPFLIAAILLIAAVVIALFSAARFLEFLDRSRYQDCSTLIGRDTSRANRAFSREEHGYNANQNHLASIVHVKSGFLRLQILRLVFWAINTLAIYLFNLGMLGGIPTIMSARWVLIDKGKRVIFMTNYVGPWDSYINEFSELDGVRGVNAIWSNTAIPDPDAPTAKKLINFPLSSFLLWNGAENERQFKSYIRASQIETLVWYGAYTNMSVSNINNNTALRNSLFDHLSTADFDDFAKRL